MLEIQRIPRTELIKLLEFYSDLLQSPATYSYKEIERTWEEIEEAREEELDAVWRAYVRARKRDGR